MSDLQLLQFKKNKHQATVSVAECFQLDYWSMVNFVNSRSYVINHMLKEYQFDFFTLYQDVLEMSDSKPNSFTRIA